MKGISWIIFLLMLVTLNISAQDISKNYKKEIKKERKEKDLEFLDVSQSPLAPEEIKNFMGLNYFKPNINWLISARLERKSTPDTIKMKTTTERLPLYIVYGVAYFEVDGHKDTLTIYRNVGLMTKPGFEDYLFVPFTDQTSGEESYGGGRYIDARIPKDNAIILDFNRAYNPYCVYSKKYSCPIPPRENHIDFRVVAGEKNYH